MTSEDNTDREYILYNHISDQKDLLLSASSLICNNSLKFCQSCGSPVIKKGYQYYELGGTELHRCSGSKSERLARRWNA